MDNKPSELDDYQGREFEEKAYQYLKAKWEHDPEDLTEIEGGLLLLFQTCRHLDAQERAREYIEHYRGCYEKAKALLAEYKAGTYQGENFTIDFFNILPVGSDHIVKLLGDIDLVIEMGELNNEYVEYDLKMNPLMEKTSFTPKEYTCIEEERQNLIDAGYPEKHLEAMAKKRGTFKAFMGAEHLPPIDLDARAS